MHSMNLDNNTLSLASPIGFVGKDFHGSGGCYYLRLIDVDGKASIEAIYDFERKTIELNQSSENIRNWEIVPNGGNSWTLIRR